jgi:hypothetical protein
LPGSLGSVDAEELRAHASDRGCEAALDEAIEIIEQLAVVVERQERTIGQQAATVRDLSGTIARLTQRRPAVSAAVLIEGPTTMSGTSISIDDRTGKAKLAWEDDHGDVTSKPDGALVSWSSNDVAVATIAVDTADPTGDTADITPVAVGTAVITATVTAADGTPLQKPDGTGPFTIPPAEVDVVPGAADQVVLSVAP